MQIFPSLFACDQTNFKEAITNLDKAGCEGYHFDIMDFDFAPNLALGFKLIGDIKKFSNSIIDIHVMGHYPEKYIEKIKKELADNMTFHIEAKSDFNTENLIKKCKEEGLEVGLAINPGTHIDLIKPYLDQIHKVLIMSVWPGYSGQSFIPESIEKIKGIKNILPPDVKLEIDGGITKNHIELMKKLGMDQIVMGNSIFKGDYVKNFEESSKSSM